MNEHILVWIIATPFLFISDNGIYEYIYASYFLILGFVRLYMLLNLHKQYKSVKILKEREGKDK